MTISYPRNPKDYQGERVSSTETFVKKLSFVWGDLLKLDPEYEYTSSTKKVRIICNAHGGFMVSPTNVLNRKGCPVCARDRSSQSLRTPAEEVIRTVDEFFGSGKYVLNMEKYRNARSKIKVYCTLHNTHEYRSVASMTMDRYVPCRICDRENSLKDHNKVIEDFNKIHKDRYDYSLVEYKGSNEKVEIVCNYGDRHTFWMTPNSHLEGKGCPKCNTGQYTPFNMPQRLQSVPATLYLVRIFNERVSFHKFGITRRSIKARMASLRKDGYEYEIIACVNGTFLDVVIKEHEIKQYIEKIGAAYKISYLKESLTHGWTECVSDNVDLSSFF